MLGWKERKFVSVDKIPSQPGYGQRLGQDSDLKVKVEVLGYRHVQNVRLVVWIVWKVRVIVGCFRLNIRLLLSVKLSDNVVEGRELQFLLEDVQFQALCLTLTSPAAIVTILETWRKVARILFKSK